MGFTEILLILVVGIVFLGPQKLPSMIIEVVRFFKRIKSTTDDLAQTVNQELQLDELKKEKENLSAQFKAVKPLKEVDETLVKVEKNWRKAEQNIDSQIQKDVEIYQNAREDLELFDEFDNEIGRPLKQKEQRQNQYQITDETTILSQEKSIKKRYENVKEDKNV